MSSETSPARLLIVEDDAKIADLLVTALGREGYACEVCHDGISGLAAARRGQADLVLLDVMLPGLDGHSVARQLRAESEVPILMLTARDQESDKVLGLELGADDYVTKPFSIAELRARVRALLRRSQAAAKPVSSEEVVGGDVRLDPDRRRVSVAGRDVELTATEFDLLAHLMGQPGRVFTREQLLDKVWGYGHDGYGRTVDSHMTRLRKKIELDPKKPKKLHTLRGVGYKFEVRQ